MDLTSTIAKSTFNLVAELIRKRLSERSASTLKERSLDVISLEGHLQEVLKWSERDQFFGMGVPNLIDESTIGLLLHTEPRRFRAAKSSSDTKNEGDLLSDQENYLLLGEPGSGKTTTLKRIARKLLMQEPSSDTDTYQYPVLVRLRELKRGSSLLRSIAESLGVPYQLHTIKVDGEEYVEARVGKRILLDAMAELLNLTGAVVLLDGLDEINEELRGQIVGEMVTLGLRLNGSKIVASMRSGDYSRHPDGFNITEICPLTPEQILLIAGKWISDTHEFLQKLEALPYYDIADRPLLLTQLLLLYRRYGYLPEQPALIYEKLVNLLLQEWDAQRGIIRSSKYSGFTPERKASFLAAVAYTLTYKAQAKSFAEQDLVGAYLQIYKPFNLPESEAQMVAREIQSHSGIILASGVDRYEFAHLSLQEYLCAQYLVKEPFAEALLTYLTHYPPPLAVAVALASNPGNWLGGLILREQNFRAFTPQGLQVFLSRLYLERPFFGSSIPAGLVFCKLFYEYRSDSFPSLYQALIRLAEAEEVVESIAAALRWFKGDLRASESGKMIVLRSRFGFLNQFGFEVPESGLLPMGVLERAVEKEPGCLVVEEENGLLRPFVLKGENV